MKFLLDTHVFLWFINDSPNLKRDIADLLESDVELWLSIASLWEIAIKVNLNKLTIPDNFKRFFPQQITLNNIEILPVTFEHLTVVANLPQHHRDPFDRLLIAQAISEPICLISADRQFDSYPINRRW
ncbi:type II toxin-antitoxin system VapC family toxin [Roseofilum sp. BLCC_M91]|uniref:Type II toxin-antitoxin system VapC family toxin n=1 Tax=Roseofilum halophilum BLCC-M91 TaxID=3022259 RepID=A0ABT7BIA6_9CYAN|nr:type II toxin-antitoxin system VapC family toxin [Roseofilum halophilum]MDJ1177998.1 type II toxin-antitoxin system VapC family toxin [Roseofilum halophilum BLCC-M91]